MTTPDPAALAAAMRAAQQATDTADWSAAARHLRRAAALATALADTTPASAPQTAPAAQAHPAPAAAPTPDADAAAVADHLRTLDTVPDGAAHLDTLNLTAAQLRAVAAACGLTRLPSGLSRAALRDRVLQQAIGARRKFAGLRHW